MLLRNWKIYFVEISNNNHKIPSRVPCNSRIQTARPVEDFNLKSHLPMYIVESLKCEVFFFFYFILGLYINYDLKKLIGNHCHKDPKINTRICQQTIIIIVIRLYITFQSATIENLKKKCVTRGLYTSFISLISCIGFTSYFKRYYYFQK